uniref:Uncharacterized protein n=1 Tax=Anguilla anguilla TaxID=7936 RepID=A0A0E9VX68_ANGAN
MTLKLRHSNRMP